MLFRHYYYHSFIFRHSRWERGWVGRKKGWGEREKGGWVGRKKGWWLGRKKGWGGERKVVSEVKGVWKKGRRERKRRKEEKKSE